MVIYSEGYTITMPVSALLSTIVLSCIILPSLSTQMFRVIGSLQKFSLVRSLAGVNILQDCYVSIIQWNGLGYKPSK